jgi:hypothetical protein
MIQRAPCNTKAYNVQHATHNASAMPNEPGRGAALRQARSERAHRASAPPSRSRARSAWPRPLRCIPLRCIPLRCIPLRCIPLRCIPLRCARLRCARLRRGVHRCRRLPCDTQRRTSAAACAAKPRESGDPVTSAARCARVALATHVCTKYACVCAQRLCPCVRVCVHAFGTAGGGHVHLVRTLVLVQDDATRRPLHHCCALHRRAHDALHLWTRRGVA